VILAAGAVGSPTLLELSGVGGGERLRSLGIDVVHDLPGVGENLQDHLQLRPVFRVEGVRTLNEDYARLWKRGLMALEYAFLRTGPLTMAPSQLGLFTRSSPDYETPNLEFHVQPLSLDKWGEGLHPFPAFTASVCNLRPSSRGSVHVTEPGKPPAIRPNYLSTEEDRRVAADAIRLARRIVGQELLRRFRPREVTPGAELTTEEELVRAAGAIGTTIFHPVGTAKMGSRERPNGGAGRAPAGARDRASAGHRRLRHAADHLGQHQFADGDDCGEGGGDGFGGYPLKGRRARSLKGIDKRVRARLKIERRSE
jgi:choline dehydrogenase-like flavoprotein